MEITTHKSRQTGIVTHHEYRGIYLKPSGKGIEVTKHYWHGSYRSLFFADIAEATKQIDYLLDAETIVSYSSCDGFIYVEKEKSNA